MAKLPQLNRIDEFQVFFEEDTNASSVPFIACTCDDHIVRVYDSSNGRLVSSVADNLGSESPLAISFDIFNNRLIVIDSTGGQDDYSIFDWSDRSITRLNTGLLPEVNVPLNRFVGFDNNKVYVLHSSYFNGTSPSEGWQSIRVYDYVDVNNTVSSFPPAVLPFEPKVGGNKGSITSFDVHNQDIFVGQESVMDYRAVHDNYSGYIGDWLGNYDIANYYETLPLDTLYPNQPQSTSAYVNTVYKSCDVDLSLTSDYRVTDNKSRRNYRIAGIELVGGNYFAVIKQAPNNIVFQRELNDVPANIISTCTIPRRPVPTGERSMDSLIAKRIGYRVVGRSDTKDANNESTTAVFPKSRHMILETAQAPSDEILTWDGNVSLYFDDVRYILDNVYDRGEDFNNAIMEFKAV